MYSLLQMYTIKHHKKFIVIQHEQKENDNFPANESKNKEYCDLTEEFKIAVTEKINKLQKNKGNKISQE